MITTSCQKPSILYDFLISFKFAGEPDLLVKLFVVTYSPKEIHLHELYVLYMQDFYNDQAMEDLLIEAKVDPEKIEELIGNLISILYKNKVYEWKISYQKVINVVKRIKQVLKI